ncbi:hypothetical protein G4B88_021375 [Cannabis sativa]|uniref:Reverse transcriptase zinc-binding domain-containing protein n=1 Tax=Cannabis sativa TaxID=3483 RepID=A0A7J6DPT1_CANSA|nr:hypothetical protein G4B88_021375 [Cannabis sativa]
MLVEQHYLEREGTSLQALLFHESLDSMVEVLNQIPDQMIWAKKKKKKGLFNEDHIWCTSNEAIECILSIPLSLFNHEDSWFWHYTNHGSYSVGSGYNLAMTVDKFQPSSASDVFSLWWKQFWGLKIPRKILHFAWRGYQEILPTRNGLFRRNIASSTSCQLCGFGGESNAHAIFWCPVAQGIWNLMEFSFLHEVKEEIDFKNVLLYASEVVDREAFAKFIICSWAIWNERNKITHGQQIRQPQFVVEWISSYYESILSMKEGPKKSSQANGRNREASAGSSTSAQEQSCIEHHEYSWIRCGGILRR